MLASGNYVQWKSRIKRYIDTKPNNELIYYCLQNPPYKDKLMISTPPGDVLCLGYVEMWKAIERLKQARMAKILLLVTEDDEMSKKKEIDKLMALISLSFKKIYKPTNNNLRTSSNTSKANQDNSPRINRGTRYDNQRVVNVSKARENVGTQVVQQFRIQCYNCKEYGHVARECQKPKWAKDAAYHKEKMLLSHYLYMAQIQEVTPDVADNSGPIFDFEPLQEVQNDDDHYNVFNNNGDTISPENLNPFHETYLEAKEYYYADHMNVILGVYTTLDEFTDLQFDYVDQVVKCERLDKEEQIKNDKAFKENQSKQFLKEREQYFEIQDLKAQLQDKGIAIRVIPTTSVNRPQFREIYWKIERTVASESMNQKPSSTIRKLYEHVSKTCSWWYPKFTPSRYKWKPKSPIGNVNTNVSIPLGNESRTANILEPMTPRCSTLSNTPLSLNSFAARTVKFGNDQSALILGYGDLVQRNITIKRVYYIEGLNHNLFSVGQFCDADLEVAFRKSTCYICDLKGNDLLTGSRGTDLYSITLQDTSTPNRICLMAKASSSQAWLWHRHLSHLNFDTINLLSKNDIVIGLPKLKFIKDHLCSRQLNIHVHILHRYKARHKVTPPMEVSSYQNEDVKQEKVRNTFSLSAKPGLNV
ncbi:retrovirus-related pol polyprotein from transposon TNT 1-94 [Tanacetum coccineum]|uniref:Retrovirus-related pol polyprotein from transposon TNT 1-94 n=1 Tax=Tanacetum coccineum TaxID=301880 RepID=A0ABQ5ICC9_9ASTR